MYFNNQGGGSQHQRGHGASSGAAQGNGQPQFNFMGPGSDFFNGFQNFHQQFGSAFGQPGNSSGMNSNNIQFSQSNGGRSRGSHHGAAAQSEPVSGGIDNSVDISNHSVSMTLMEPSESVVLRGHNCKIEIGAGNTISHLLITGHNNKVFSKGNSSGSGNSTFGVIEQVEVMGHNNRVESIIANSLKVHGHNNRFSHIVCSGMQDSGICNQFHSCQQQPPSQSRASQGARGAAAQHQSQRQRQAGQAQRSSQVQHQQPQDVGAAHGQGHRGHRAHQSSVSQQSHVNIAAEEQCDDPEYGSESDQNVQDDYSDEESPGQRQDIRAVDQDNMIEPSMQDDIQERIGGDQDDDQEDRYINDDLFDPQGDDDQLSTHTHDRFNRMRNNQRGPQLNRQHEDGPEDSGDDDDDNDDGDDSEREQEIDEQIIDDGAHDDIENGIVGDELDEIGTQFDLINQQFAQQQAHPSHTQHQQHTRTSNQPGRSRGQNANMQQQSNNRRSQQQPGSRAHGHSSNPQQNYNNFVQSRLHQQQQSQSQSQQHQNQRRPANGNSSQTYTFTNMSGGGQNAASSVNPNDPNFQNFLNGIPGIGSAANANAQSSSQAVPNQPRQHQQQPPHQQPASGATGQSAAQGGQGQPGQTGQNGQNFINLQGIMSDVQNMLSQLQTQNPGIQMNFNGVFNGQPGQRQQQSYQYSSNGQNQQFYFNGMPQNGQQNYPDGSYQQQQFWNGENHQDDYGDEEQAQLDEDGQPLQSPEEIKNIINSIASFKYEEKKQPASGGDLSQPNSSQNKDTNNKDSCAICLEDLQGGQMVKALACSHKFHSKCINFWLKQKLKCPLCKERINLQNYA